MDPIVSDILFCLGLAHLHLIVSDFWRGRHGEEAGHGVARAKGDFLHLVHVLLSWGERNHRPAGWFERIHFSPGLMNLILQRLGAFVQFLRLCHDVAYIHIRCLPSQHRIQKGIVQLVVVFRLLGLGLHQLCALLCRIIKDEVSSIKIYPLWAEII